MPKLSVILAASAAAATTLAASGALAQALGTVTKAMRPQVSVYDANGAPLGPVKAADLHLPQPIVGFGKGNSVGIKQEGRVIYMRGLDVMTDKAKAACKPVQVAARAKGSAYAASNMGLGGAADCGQ